MNIKGVLFALLSYCQHLALNLLVNVTCALKLPCCTTNLLFNSATQVSELSLHEHGLPSIAMVRLLQCGSYWTVLGPSNYSVIISLKYKGFGRNFWPLSTWYESRYKKSHHHSLWVVHISFVMSSSEIPQSCCNNKPQEVFLILTYFKVYYTAFLVGQYFYYPRNDLVQQHG